MKFQLNWIVKTEIQVTLSPKTSDTTSSHSILNTACMENKTNCCT